MKTVLITIYQAVEAKNILRTKVIKGVLAQPDVRAVCLVRFPERAEYYRRDIQHERIIYDAFYRRPDGLFERFFGWLKLFLIRTRTTNLRRRMRLEESGDYFSYYTGLLMSWLLARPQVRRVSRFWDYFLVGDPGFGAVFEKYRPDAVLAANLFDDVEIALIREARRRKIPTVGFINSWDKLTARYAIRLLPDQLAVYNDIVKREAVRHADMPEERIAVCGVPQYDWHFNRTPSPRGEFSSKRGLDHRKPLIVFAPMGREFSNSDWDAIDLMHKIVAGGRLGREVELLIRFQPNDFLDDRELASRPWLKYELPGRRFGTARGGDWDMNFEEMTALTDTLAHISILVSYASSMSVEAAIHGKPVVNINFELREGEPWSKSPTFYYHTEHYRKAIELGGIRLVESKEELVRWLDAYLKDPSLDAEGRKRLVAAQCSRLDGKAGERIAQVIAAFLRQSHRWP